MARNNPEDTWQIKQTPRIDPKFQKAVSLTGVGRTIIELFNNCNKWRDFIVGADITPNSRPKNR
jgi:hypothetical protein